MSLSELPQEGTVNPEAPWLGLLPFTEAASRYFFGRARELDELYERVVARSLTLLFGQSGLGKSSLLQAALVPRLRDNGFVPVSLRLRHDDDAPSLEQQVFGALGTATTGLGMHVEGAPSLWHLLHDPAYGFCVAGAPRIVLILDQFEEVFTIGKSRSRVRQTEAFLSTLADMVENRVPEFAKRELAEHEELADRIDYGARPIRLLLSMREDYLHQLERHRAAMPSMMDNRMELRHLNGQYALKAAVEPGRMRCHDNRELRPIVGVETGEAIVRLAVGASSDASLDDIDEVPPFLLSLLCEQLNLERTKRKQPEITPDLVSLRVEHILDQYYEDCFDNQPEAVRRLVEERLVRKDGHRDWMFLENFLAELQTSKVAEPKRDIERLLARRLLTKGTRGERECVELTHDKLTSVVVRSRVARHAKRRRNRQVLCATGVLAASVVVGVLGLWQWRLAKEARVLAAATADRARALAVGMCNPPRPVSESMCKHRGGSASKEHKDCKVPFVSFDPSDREAYDEVACAFWRKHGIRVERISCDEDGFRDHRIALLTQYPGGVFTWAPGQPIEPFTDAIFPLSPKSLRKATEKTWRPLIRSLKDGEFGGMYSIPFKFYPWAIYYHKPSVVKHGPFEFLRPSTEDPRIWREPSTWAELIATAEEIRKKKNLSPFAFSFKEGATWTAIGTFDILNLRLHGYEDHERLLQNTLEESQKNAHLEELFKRWAELVPYYAASWRKDTVKESALALRQGEAVMYLTGSFFLKYVEADRQDFGLFNFPSMGPTTGAKNRTCDQDKDAIDAPIDTFVGSTATDKTKLDCAVELLRFLGSDEDAFAAYNAKNDLYLPVNDKALSKMAEPLTRDLVDTPQRRAARLVKGLSTLAGFTDRRVLKLEGKSVTPALRQFLEDAYAHRSTTDAIGALISEMNILAELE